MIIDAEDHKDEEARPLLVRNFNDDDNHESVIGLDDLIDYFGVGIFTVKLMALLGIVCFANGALFNAISTVLILRWACDKPDSSDVMDPTVAWLILCSGFALGSLFYGWIADRHGRKFSLVFATTLSFYFTILICFTENRLESNAILFFIGTGMCSLLITSNYSSESFPGKYRPVLQTFLGICSYVGAASASYLASTQYLPWRSFTMVIGASLTIFLLIPAWLPESIPYLQMSGCLDELLVICKRLSESHRKDVHNKRVKMLVYTNTKRGHILKLFSKPYLGRTLRMMLLWTTSRMALALSTVLHYNIAMKDSKDVVCPENNVSLIKRFSYNDLFNCLKQGDFFYATFCGSMAQIVGLGLTCILINTFRRKSLIVLSLLMTCCCFAISNMCLPVTLHFLFALLSIGFSACFDQVLRIFTNETYDTPIRCTATGFCNFFGLVILIALPMIIQLVSVLTPLVMTIIYLAMSLECFAVMFFVK